MPSCPTLKFNLYLVWKRILRTKIFFFFLAGFILFLVLFWWQGGFSYARRFFLFLFPYLFLLVAQDIFREEIDSGCLENVVFLRFNFRSYLVEKNLSLFLIAAIFSGLLFSPFLVVSIGKHDFSWFILVSFFMGLIVGFYYLSLAGWLGLKLRSGSNVLAIILIQVFLFLALLVSLTSSSSGRQMLDLIFSARPQNRLEQIILSLFVALWPNALVAHNYSSLSLRIEPLVLISIFLGLQIWRLNRLELKRE